jgi:hypothetical protein
LMVGSEIDPERDHRSDRQPVSSLRGTPQGLPVAMGMASLSIITTIVAALLLNEPQGSTSARNGSDLLRHCSHDRPRRREDPGGTGRVPECHHGRGSDRLMRSSEVSDPVLNRPASRGSIGRRVTAGYVSPRGQ